jgi:hypothetical protein
MLKIASFENEIKELDTDGSGESALAAAAVDFAAYDSDDLYRVAGLIAGFAEQFDSTNHVAASKLDSLLLKIAANPDNFWSKPERAKVETKPWREGLGPLGEALSSRHSPDLPGVSLERVSDGVFKDSVTGKTYDFNRGFVLDDGTEYKGGSVSAQTPKANEKMQPIRQQIEWK